MTEGWGARLLSGFWGLGRRVRVRVVCCFCAVSCALIKEGYEDQRAGASEPREGWDFGGSHVIVCGYSYTCNVPTLLSLLRVLCL